MGFLLGFVSKKITFLKLKIHFKGGGTVKLLKFGGWWWFGWVCGLWWHLGLGKRRLLNAIYLQRISVRNKGCLGIFIRGVFCVKSQNSMGGLRVLTTSIHEYRLTTTDQSNCGSPCVGVP
jgi:hypothetical protein